MVSKLLCHAFVQYASWQRASFTRVGIVGMAKASSTYWIHPTDSRHWRFFIGVGILQQARWSCCWAMRWCWCCWCFENHGQILWMYVCVHISCAHVSKASSVRNGLQYRKIVDGVYSSCSLTCSLVLGMVSANVWCASVCTLRWFCGWMRERMRYVSVCMYEVHTFTHAHIHTICSS